MTLLGLEWSFLKPRETEKMDRGVSVAVFQNDSKSSHNEMVSDFDQQKQSEVASYL